MDLTNLKHTVSDCTRCRLHETRTMPVFGEGDEKARIMLIGEAPGKDEDISGRPFVGKAGKLLDSLLEEAGSSRDEVYITNAVKCRPPENRNPRKDEQSACIGYLLEQIKMIDPDIIAPMGLSPLTIIMDIAGIEDDPKDLRYRRRRIDLGNLKVDMYPIYHPAACLYNPNLRSRALEGIRDLLDMKN